MNLRRQNVAFSVCLLRFWIRICAFPKKSIFKVEAKYVFFDGVVKCK